MNNKRFDSFAKIRYGCRIVLMIIFLIISVLLLKLCSEIVSDNREKVNRTFEEHYNVVENKIDGFEKISEALFYNSDVKSFCKALKGDYNAYKVVPVSKMIGLFEKFFNEGQYRIVLSTLEDRICADGKGSVYLNELCSELMLSEVEIKRIKNSPTNVNLYLYEQDKGIATFIFSHQYSKDIGRIYCFVIADVNVFLTSENFIISTKKDVAEEKDSNKSFLEIKNIQKRESLMVPGLFYEYSSQNNNFVLFAFLLVCLAICILCMIYSRKISEKVLNITYMPLVKAAKKIGIDDSVQKIQAWDETAKKLIQNSERLRSELKENNEFRKKSYLRNLMYNMQGYEESHLEKYGLRYLDSKCRVILIDFMSEKEIDYAVIRELSLDSEFGKNLEKMVSVNMSGEFVTINELRYVYITDSCDEDEIKKNLVNVLNFAEEFNSKVFITVGSQVEGLKNINVSFRNAIDINEKEKMLSSTSIVFSDGVEKDALNFYYPLDLEIQLIDNTLKGNYVDVTDVLNNLLYENMHEISLTDDKMREFKIVIIGTVNRIINMMNKNSDDIFKDSLSIYVKIGGSSSKEEFEKNVRTVFKTLCASNENRKVLRQDKLASDIMMFIESNFSDTDLSLEKIARTFYISENHVSRVLKNKIGKGYKEYLNDLRINEAKRLLKATVMTVNSIANSVGYADIRAFNKIFKKYTAVSPNEYRNMS